MSDKAQIEWPNEIWAEELDGALHGLWRPSQAATVGQPLEYARYVNGNLHENQRKYFEALLENVRAERDAALARNTGLTLAHNAMAMEMGALRAELVKLTGAGAEHAVSA